METLGAFGACARKDEVFLSKMRKLWYESMFHVHKTIAATIIQRCYRAYVWRRNVLYNPNTLTGALYLKIVFAVYAHRDGLITPSGRSQ